MYLINILINRFIETEPSNRKKYQEKSGNILI